MAARLGDGSTQQRLREREPHTRSHREPESPSARPRAPRPRWPPWWRHARDPAASPRSARRTAHSRGDSCPSQPVRRTERRRGATPRTPRPPQASRRRLRTRLLILGRCPAVDLDPVPLQLERHARTTGAVLEHGARHGLEHLELRSVLPPVPRRTAVQLALTEADVTRPPPGGASTRLAAALPPARAADRAPSRALWTVKMCPGNCRLHGPSVRNLRGSCPIPQAAGTDCRLAAERRTSYSSRQTRRGARVPSHRAPMASRPGCRGGWRHRSAGGGGGYLIKSVWTNRHALPGLNAPNVRAVSVIDDERHPRGCAGVIMERRSWAPRVGARSGSRALDSATSA